MFQWLIDLTRTSRYNTPHERLNYSLWWNCETGVVKYSYIDETRTDCAIVLVWYIWLTHTCTCVSWKQRECLNPVCVRVGHFENGTSPTKQYTKNSIRILRLMFTWARNQRGKLAVPLISSGQIETNNEMFDAMTAHQMNWDFSFFAQTYGILQNLSGRLQKPRVGIQFSWTHITHNFFAKNLNEWKKWKFANVFIQTICFDWISLQEVEKKFQTVISQLNYSEWIRLNYTESTRCFLIHPLIQCCHVQFFPFKTQSLTAKIQKIYLWKIIAK